MNNQIDKNNAWLKEALLAKVKEYGPEIWRSVQLSLAKDLLYEDLILTGRALLDSGANHEKATHLISKYWDITVRDAEPIVKEAQARNDHEKKLNAGPKFTKKNTQSR